MKENEILKIRYYILPFFIFIFVLLFFQNIYFLLFTLFIFIFLYSYIWFKNKNINFISIIFLIAFLTLSSYIYFISKTYNTFTWYTEHFTKENYKVVDILRWWKYLIQDNFWSNFILHNVKEQLNYQDIVTIYGMLYPLKLDYDNFQEFIKNQFLSKKISFSNITKIFDFDYKNYLIMKGIAWNIYSKKIYKKYKEKVPFYQKIRMYIKDKIDNIYVDNKYKALVLWILIWDKSYLSDKIYNEFINSWLVHIIVVSWWNIMFLIMFLSVLLFFIPFYVRIFIIWIFVIIYSMVAGFDSSVIRASIMWIFSLLALFFGRLTDTKRLLAFAFMIMLLINPYFLLYDLGFILSFLAILWILTFNYFKIDWKKYLKYLYYFYNNYILPTLWASFFISPAIILFTKKLNIIWFIANIFVVPFIPILIIVNIFLLIFNWTFIWDILYYISINIIDYILYVSYLFWEKITYFINI